MVSTNQSTTASLPYDPALFVGREQEVALVAGIARQMIQGAKNQARAIVFHGERGVGKTWLSLYLHRTILPEISGVTSLLINLFPSREGEFARKDELFAKTYPFVEKNHEKVTQEIIEWVAGRIQAQSSPEASLSEIARWLAQTVEQQFKHQVLVLILDSVFEADWSLLEQLETYLLAPLAALPQVLIVMTGRGRLYPWASPYLRVEASERALKAFTPQEVIEQLRRQAPDAEHRAEEIVQLGGGHPMSNILLATSATQSEALETVVDALLSVIPSDDQRQQARAYFEALCLLDGFREDEIPAMLAAYFDDPHYETFSTAQTRHVRDLLVKTHLVRWEEGKFVLDKSVQHILENLLKMTQPEIWRRLHCRAYLLYREWANEYSRFSEYYTARADRHASILLRAGINPEACSDSVEAHAADAIDVDTALVANSA
jgi:hypothetical protein